MGTRVRINRASANNASRLVMSKDLANQAFRAVQKAKSDAPKETGTLAANLDWNVRLSGNGVILEIGVFNGASHVTRFSGEDQDGRPSVAQVLIFVESRVKAVRGKKMRWRAFHNSSAKFVKKSRRKSIPENNFLVRATQHLMSRYRGDVTDLTH